MRSTERIGVISAAEKSPRRFKRSSLKSLPGSAKRRGPGLRTCANRKRARPIKQSQLQRTTAVGRIARRLLSLAPRREWKASWSPEPPRWIKAKQNGFVEEAGDLPPSLFHAY